ncbi:MAG: FecR domain-containing protein [Verrucomicrobiae bacterium]|nr:FecR domain-containing protein [Verrucomicrobiae bacterium]
MAAIPALLAAAAQGAELERTIFTQVVNQVRVVGAETRAIVPAKLQDEFNTPDLIQTGPRSLAELTAPDKTITRVGSNTIFSYAKRGRTVNLQQGSVLFHSPKGKGGGVIRTKAASASVLGTTLIVSASVDGGFKCVVLEGKAELQMPNGNYRIARAGQAVYVMATGEQFGPTVDVNLEKLVDGSNLVQEFDKPLPSLPKVNEAVERQKQDIDKGRLVPHDDQPQNLAPAAGAAEPDAAPTIPSSTVTQTIEALADRLTRAVGTDLTISGTPFNTDHLFTEAVNSTVSGLNKTSFKGVLGHNITIAPAAATSSAVSLDFTDSISANSSFSILADAVLRINSPHLELFSSSHSPLNLTTDGGLFLVGRTGVEIASGSVISAQGVGNLTIASGASMALDAVSVVNSSRSVTLNANNHLTMVGGGLTAATGHDVLLRTASGNLLVQNAAIRGQQVTYHAGNNLTVNNGSAQANQLNFYAAGDMTISGLAMSGVSSTVMEARTLILSDINFTGTVTLYSQIGQLAANPNSGAQAVIGHVNFIQNVNYNGSPAQFSVGADITIAARP